MVMTDVNSRLLQFLPVQPPGACAVVHVDQVVALASVLTRVRLTLVHNYKQNHSMSVNKTAVTKQRLQAPWCKQNSRYQATVTIALV